MRTTDHPLPDTGPGAAGREFGRGFVTALAAKDTAGLLAMFSSEVDFQAMTPGRTWQARTAAEVVGGILLGAWFEPSDVIERIEAVETSPVGTRLRLGYRLLVTNPGGAFTVEQQAFLDLSGGRITWLRMLCSGFCPRTEDAPGGARPAP